MKKIILQFFILSFITTVVNAQDFADYVNPFIGTTNYGATNPGAIAPRGMVSVVPFNTYGGETTFEKDSGWLSQVYERTNSHFTGFSHVNLSGVGCPDLGAVIVMPTTGEIDINPLTYGSTISNQEARAGYFSTHIDKYDIDTELTATQRAGISKYKFPAGKANLLLNLGQALSNESGALVKVVNEQEIEGMRMVGSFCYNNPKTIYPVYFVMKVNKKANKTAVWQQHNKIEGPEAQWMAAYNGQQRIIEDAYYPIIGDSLGAIFSYDFAVPTEVEVKIGISYVSIENARKNLETEVSNVSFDEIANRTKDNWNSVLSKIKVEGGSEDDKTVFYTALYHTMIHPNVLSDVNGEYPASKTRKTKTTEGERYTVFSLWDTYRDLHQLMTLVYPKQQLNMVNTMLDIYDETGWLPKWELNSTETYTMVGDPAAIVIADTYMRGLNQFDHEKAFEAVTKSAYSVEGGNPVRPCIDSYIEYGYIPVDNELDKKLWASVSTSLEYYVADWGVAQFAKSLGKQDKYKEFKERAYGYKKLFDKETDFLRPRHKDGKWYSPFDPNDGANFTHNIGYVEGNAYQYNMMVQFDIPGLIKQFGTKAFENRLDEIFSTGQFDMANEPDIAYPYAYNYIKGKEYKTQEKVLELREKYFTNKADGIAGNDDTGTMSAWVVFSMMGIYPDAPGTPQYALTTPAFDKVTIELDSKYWGKDQVVIKKQGGESNHIQSIKVNGKPHRGYFINHKDLVGANEITINMK
ncbi:GH92 family glycosyl hydrolase [Flammeovirga kamogawensis]|uniref:GH92 family glycosyl hydrolase n=1 Tax=Flammeovirga kamogawensis TaxID=373891 RepID=A0ABX8GX31_9BACT|nr:GH92 family glycosyl hydrolase [Flammeovirga kamogawensis]MBB6460533.1 putative alpha-1,2-mannosidase [Flammeovirga kamogawensis]QWG07896.1 GH92 family glycosyl hydrolase [Flammeovirga kamogawensis]TRX69702.1 glycoside hydrolase family 92 protein [Flammeovirga kamogawensis]